MSFCIICGKEFNTDGIIITCSEECKKKRINETHKFYDRGIHGYVLYKKNCVICGEEFETYRSVQKTCLKEKCKKELAKIKDAKNAKKNKDKINERSRERYRKKRNVDPNKICIICGREFINYHSSAIACSEECKKIRKLNLDKERNIGHGKRFKELDEGCVVPKINWEIEKC